MKRHPVLLGILFGLFTVIPVTLLLYAGQQLGGLPFVPFNIFDFTTRVLPGSLLNFGLELTVRIVSSLHIGPIAQTAKLAEQAMGVGMFIVTGLVIGGVLAIVGRLAGFRRAPLWGLVLVLILEGAVLFAQSYLGFTAGELVRSAIWLTILFGAWGLLLGWMLWDSLQIRAEPAGGGASRREVIYLAGSAVVALIASAIGLGFLFARQKPAPVAAATATPVVPQSTQTSGQAASPSQTALAGRIQPAPGTRPEVTSNTDFYRVDINTLIPHVEAATWHLEVGGLVDNPLSLSLDEIRARPAISQYITLSCISNPIGGDLISTTLVTGLRLKDLMQEAGLQAGVQALSVKSVDGFFESVTMQDMMDERTLLVYEMNGETLPPGHGFPLRLYIPTHYGMKQPKWILSIEAIDNSGSGYWEERGWSQAAVVRTLSIIDNVALGQPDPGTGNLPIGGIAYSGARGINKVEVQIDDGPWAAAVVRDPPLSELTWVQWRYDWPPQAGGHVARVRAYDGDGALQIVESQSAFPDGAGGVDSFSFTV